MKFGETTIPTPPKGFQTMFHVWLLSQEFTLGDDVFCLNPQEKHVLQEHQFFVDSQGRLNSVHWGEYTTHQTLDDWERWIADTISEFNESTDDFAIYDFESDIAAFNFENTEYGVCWHLVGNAHRGLRALASMPKLSAIEEDMLMALFQHLYPEKLVSLKKYESAADFLHLCKSVIRQIPIPQKNSNTPPLSWWVDTAKEGAL